MKHKFCHNGLISSIVVGGFIDRSGEIECLEFGSLEICWINYLKTTKNIGFFYEIK